MIRSYTYTAIVMTRL